MRSDHGPPPPPTAHTARLPLTRLPGDPLTIAGLTRYLLRRIVLTVPLLFAVVTVTFVVTHILPGDPTYSIVGQLANDELIESVRHRLGFDLPLWHQYVDYLRDALHLDLGTSLRTGNAVTEDLRRRLPATLELVVLSLGFALVTGVSAGALAAFRRGRAADAWVRATTFVALSVPSFWLALVLLYFFFFKLGIAPAPTGQLSTTDPLPRHITGAALLDSILTGNSGALRASLSHAVLPVISLGLIIAAPFARLTRSSTIAVLGSDYVAFGRACGLRRFTVWRYAVRAALPPVITFAGIVFSLLIGGAVLVEKIFSWPGAAQYAAQAITENDYAATQAFVLLTAVISVVVFLVVDVLTMVIDPRVTLARRDRSRSPLASRRPPRSARSLAAPRASVSDALAGLRALVARSASLAAGSVRLALAAGPRLVGARLVASSRRLDPFLVAGLGIIVLLLLGSVVVPALSGFGAHTPNPSEGLLAPSWRHPFGTDEFGLDVFTRTFYAPRIDLPLAAAGVGIGAVAGVFLGLVAGASRGWLGEAVMRATDVIQAFPLFVLALALISLTGNDRHNVIWVIGFLNVPIFLRLIRSEVLTVRELRFVEAGVALGNSHRRLALRHILPNAVGPVIVQAGVQLGFAIELIAGLAFLGVGIHVPTPEWGSMIQIGASDIITGQWWTAVFPGLGLVLAVTGFNLVSEGLERAREL